MHRVRSSARPILLASLFLGVAASVRATNVTTDITTNTTWTSAGNPYVLMQGISIHNNAVLTIMGGVIVQGKKGAGQLNVGGLNAGGLQVLGTAGSPVTFTSNAATPAAGDWYGIEVWPNALSSSISYATVSYAGLASAYAGLEIQQSAVTVDHVTIQNGSAPALKITNASPTITSATLTSSTWGLYITTGGSPSVSTSTISANTSGGVYVANPSTPTLQSLTITGNTGYAMSVSAATTLGTVSGITATGNTTDGCEIRGGTIAANTSWKNIGLPYVVTTSDVIVAGAATPILTVEAGTTVKFASTRTLDIANGGPGGLQAVGTVSLPIIFTSSSPPTHWSFLRFSAQSTATSQVAYTTVSYANGIYVSGCAPTFQNLTVQNGGGSYGISINGASPSLQNVTVQASGAVGVQVNGGSPTISGSTISGNTTGTGLQLLLAGTTSVTSSTITGNVNGIDIAEPASVSLQTVSLTSNTGAAMIQTPGVTFGTVSALTVTGNGTNGSKVSGTTALSPTWKNLGIPYVVTADVTIAGAGSPVLTIDPGTAIRFASAKSLIIGKPSLPGGLQAVGTGAQPITFTADSASPTAGFWYGISFASNALTSSRVSYATISYGGRTGTGVGGGIITAASVTVDNTTIQSSAYAGILINSGSPALSNVTLASSSVGLHINSPGSASLSTVTISNNSGFAITVDPAVTFGTVSGVSVSGNGTNAAEIRGGTLTASATWKNLGWPYVTVGATVNGTSNPILTIEAGTTIKFNQTSGPVIYQGALQAVGTVAQPIVFTANSSTPAPGFWYGLSFSASALPSSTIAYATITYGDSSNYGALSTNGVSPVFDHIKFISNRIAMKTTNSSPTLINCEFTSNTTAINNTTSGSLVKAGLNWWSDPSGPSGGGATGSGQPITAGVTFEPWLTTATTQPNFFSSFTLANRTFNPALGINAKFTFATSQSGSWQLQISNSGNTVVRTFSGTGSSTTQTWNGKNTGGTDQPDGTYSYVVTSTAGNAAAPAKGYVIIDRTKQLTIASVAVTQAFFSPNADGVQDTATVTATISFDDAAWTVNVRNSGNTVVRQGTGTGSLLSYQWDGKNTATVTQPDGLYTFELLATDGTASANASATTTLDNTFPIATISSPGASQTVSNIYQSGSTDVLVTGTASDANILSWTLDYILGTASPNYTTIATGTTSVSGAQLGTWATGALPNGLYTLRLRVTDKAGNLQTLSITPTIGNFKAALLAYDFNPLTGGTVTYQSTVPFTLTETLTIKNGAGAVARTLVSAVQRNAGTFNDVWDGKTGVGALLPDGPYSYYITVTAEASTVTWDLSTLPRPYTDTWSAPSVSATFDPFRNVPVVFTNDLGLDSARTSLELTADGVGGNVCAQPVPGILCITLWEWTPPHISTYTWPGTDSTGLSVSNMTGASQWRKWSNWPQNAVLVYGSKPVITNTTFAPTLYNSATGSQTFDFDLTLATGQTASVKVEYLNQASRSVLHTNTLTGQSSGHKTLTWDGKADNGMFVEPGAYTAIMTVTDSIGSVVIRHAVTAVVN